MFNKIIALFSGKGTTIKQVTTQQLKELLQEKQHRFFLDVRTKGEFKQHAIRNFTNFPLQTLENNLSKIPKDKEIIVICQSGGRSMAACQLLKKAGYTSIVNVRGGMNNWKK